MQITLLLLLSCAGLSLSAIWFGRGECPGGHKLGDTWRSEGACERCECQDGGFYCAGCGVYALTYDNVNCYDYRDMSKDYPDCCTPLLRCRGEPGFNETLLKN
ncbi:uncharacterized protein LOC106065444 [Biomphalaria glabrata]|uniref:Uncharacterized protein LOC106065444 n=1 Tax=Biomphalaria glabrata TaxID=6526 RepID=A0A9W3ACQ8_BIOGL|nr:uncharacterized protein LOC106065444 [Biomphalaria glabrata]